MERVDKVSMSVGLGVIGSRSWSWVRVGAEGIGAEDQVVKYKVMEGLVGLWTWAKWMWSWVRVRAKAHRTED